MVASVGLTYKAEEQLKIIFEDDNSWTLIQRSSYKASLKAKRPKLWHTGDPRKPQESGKV
jgi:hypothetical protein